MSALAALCSEYHAREPGEAEAAAQGEWVSALSPAPSGAGGGWLASPPLTPAPAGGRPQGQRPPRPQQDSRARERCSAGGGRDGR